MCNKLAVQASQSDAHAARRANLDICVQYNGYIANDRGWHDESMPLNQSMDERLALENKNESSILESNELLYGSGLHANSSRVLL